MRIKRVTVAVCTICMLLRPMSVLAEEVAPLEIEQSITDTEDEAKSEDDAKSGDEAKPEGEEKTEDESKPEGGAKSEDEEKSEDEAESETEENEEPAENEESVSDELDAKGEGIDKGKSDSKPRKTAMLLKSVDAPAPAGPIDISQCDDGITIDNNNLGDYNGKTITGTAPDDKNIIISGGVTVYLTIDNLVIDRRDGNYGNGRYDAIEIKDNSTLYLTLKGNNVLKGNNESGGAGIRVEEGNTLIITADSDGTLTAIGGNGRGGATGIGSGNCNYSGEGGAYDMHMPSLGTIEIHGGTIEAQGGNSYSGIDVALAAAGIGLSCNGKPGSGSITITGGTVTATGGRIYGAGIGGGMNSYVGSITISGGKVTANVTSTSNTQSGAAAIGSGYHEGVDKSSCGAISITGGIVTANGNIGYGSSRNSDDSDGFEGGSVVIQEGATVTVTSGKINHPASEVADGTVTQKYTLNVTVKNSDYTTGTVTGHITIGDGEKAFSKDITFDLGAGKATATFDLETTLYGEQPIKTVIDGKNLEEKTIRLGTENEVIYGGKQGLSLSTVSEGVTSRYENGVLTIEGVGAATISMTPGVESTTDYIVVKNGADVKLTLDNLSIDTTERKRGAITIGQDDGTASCKLIPVGENTLTREDSIEGGVIEVGDGSSLTIGGNGKLIIRSKATTIYADPRRYSAGIYAVNGEVVIEDNPNIDIRATGEALDNGIVKGYMVCIYSKNININGGQINARPSAAGHGIGHPFYKTWDTESGDVTITGGTVYAEGGSGNYENGGITGNYTLAKIIGGNVNMNKLAESIPENLQHPVNQKGSKVYCTTITVGNADDNGKNTLSINAKVKSLKIKDGETDYPYGTDGMYTDAEGKLYLWLPENSVVSEVETESGTYSGECATNNEYTKYTSGATSCKGNSFGTAEATFTIATGSEFHKFTKAVKSEATLKSPGTCKKKAVYYYTCEDCNAISMDKTFEGNIDINNHVNTEIRDKIDPVHKTQTDGYSGDKYCIDCGVKLEQGTVNKPTPHTSSAWMHDDTEHWKECTVEGCGVEIPNSRKEHYSTGEHKATCKEKAVCDVCGVQYGDVIPCQYTAKVKSEAALKTPATTTKEAVYYYSCSMCGKVEKNDQHTFVDHHEPENDPTPSARTNEYSTPEYFNPEDSASATPVAVAPALVPLAHITPTLLAPTHIEIAPVKNRLLKGYIFADSKQILKGNEQDNIADKTSNEDAEQVQDDVMQNTELLNDEKQIKGSNESGEKTSNVTGADARSMDATDTDAARKEAAMRRVAVVASAIAGSGAVSTGVYFFLKRRRMF